MNKQYLRDKDVAEMLSIGRSSVWRMAKEGKLPAPFKLSERVTVWKLSDIEAFVASRMEAVA
jgi:prophage regulatory protein